MIKGAIFDLDGTILDSMCIWDAVADDYLRSLGIQPKENLQEKFKTFTLEQSAEYFKENYGVDMSVMEIIKGINSIIENFYMYRVQLKRGAAEFLKKLQAAGVKMCVATVTDVNLVKSALKRCGVMDLFSGIITSAQVGCGKENPLIFREALKILQAGKNQTIVFEDSLHAIQTAKADGFTVVGVFDSHEENQTEIKAVSDFYIKDFCENEKHKQSLIRQVLDIL